MSPTLKEAMAGLAMIQREIEYTMKDIGQMRCSLCARFFPYQAEDAAANGIHEPICDECLDRAKKVLLYRKEVISHDEI